MRERYVRPPLVAREPGPAWRRVWPFRLLVLLVAVTAAVLLAVAYATLNDAPAQDPGLGALPGALLPGALLLSALGPVTPVGP